MNKKETLEKFFKFMEKWRYEDFNAFENHFNKLMSMKSKEQLTNENEALKDSIAVILAQKKNVHKHCDEKDQQIDQLKQQLEKVQQENKILKDIRFLERVVPANLQLHQLSNRECYLKGYDNAISETIRIFEESYGKDKVKLITERDELLMDIEKVGGYKFQIEELKQQLKEYKNKENTSAVNSWDEMLKNCENCGLNECIGCEYTQTCVQNIKQQLEEKDKLLKCYQEEEKLIAEILGDKDLTLIGSRAHLENLVVELKNKIKDRDIIIEEKDKEIELLKHLGKHETTVEMFKENAKLIIEKRQFAIQELEKVKTLIQDAINFEKPNFVEVYDAINKQIKELKGEKDVED